MGQFLLLVLAAVPAFAGTVRLAWDPPSGPPPAGYKIYFGPAAGNYPSSIDVGNTTSYAVTGLTEGATYHFAATDYDAARSESGYSNDVSATVAYSAPVAQFTASTTSGVAPLALNFINSSTGNITNHAWTFGDGTSSAVANPSHVYSLAGVYSVSLTVTGPGGSNTQTRTNYISVLAPPIDLGLYRKLSPVDGSPVYKFLLDYNLDHVPDAKTPYGIAGDVPVVGNFTPGGLTGIGVYRNGIWYLDTNRDGVADRMVGFGGIPGDIPLTGNFTGPGSADTLVIYRSGIWYVDENLDGTVNRTFGFGGVPGDIPLVGDIDGDGVADLVIYRNGTWYVDTTRSGTVTMVFGLGGVPGDVPLLLDWDRDGKADLCIYRNGVWYVTTKRDGTVQASFGFGASGDVPLAGRFH
jgi:PKD repeat protein